jgi:hypothetical protein
MAQTVKQCHRCHGATPTRGAYRCNKHKTWYCSLNCLERHLETHPKKGVRAK